VGEAHQVQVLPVARAGDGEVRRRLFRRLGLQVEAQLVDRTRRHRRPGKVGEGAQQDFQRAHHVEQDDGVGDQGCRRDLLVARQHQDQQADHHEEEDLPPARRGGEDHLAGAAFALQEGDAAAQRAQERLLPRLVHLQLLGALDQRAQVGAHRVEALTAAGEVDRGPRHRDLVGDDAEDDEAGDLEQHHPRQVAEVGHAAHHDGQVHEQHRHQDQGLDDDADVVGEGGQQLRPAEALQVAQRRAEHPFGQADPQLQQALLGEVDEQDLGEEAEHRQDDAQADEPPGQERHRAVLLGEDRGDEGDHSGVGQAADDARHGDDGHGGPRQFDVAGEPQEEANQSEEVPHIVDAPEMPLTGALKQRVSSRPVPCVDSSSRF
jgi:hypothetical protein